MSYNTTKSEGNVVSHSIEYKRIPSSLFSELSHVGGTAVDRQRCTLWCATCSEVERVETPEKVPGPNRKDRLPTTVFQGRTVKLCGCIRIKA